MTFSELPKEDILIISIEIFVKISIQKYMVNNIKIQQICMFNSFQSINHFKINPLNALQKHNKQY